MFRSLALAILFYKLVLIFQTCGEIIAIPRIKRSYGYYVKDRAIRSIQPTSFFTCAQNCIEMKLCVSINYIKDEMKCDLNYGGKPKEKESYTYVAAVDIPMEYAGQCGNHNCNETERCFPHKHYTTCLPLDIECGVRGDELKSMSENQGTKMGDKIIYTCENDTVALPVDCNTCENSTVQWDVFMETKCLPTGYWDDIAFECTDCFHSPQERIVSTSTTITNRKCQTWNSTVPHDLSSELANALFPDNSTSEIKNYCRSPVTGGQYNLPYLWCMTDDPTMIFDVCSVPKCYNIAPSRNLHPPPVQFKFSHHFADVPITRLQCRHLNGTNSTEHCPVSRYNNGHWSRVGLSCSENDCFDPNIPYIGKMSCTVTGRKCQNWNSQHPHAHSYNLNNTDDQNNNFCRNADGKPGVPWCLTTDPLVRYEYCWIPECK